MIYETYQTLSKIEGLGPTPWRDFRGEAEAKIQLFQNMVMLHIKLNGMTNAAS